MIYYKQLHLYYEFSIQPIMGHVLVSTLHTKLQKMQLSSIHTTIFVHMSNEFLTDFVRKIFAVLCVVCKSLYVRSQLPFGRKLFSCLYFLDNFDNSVRFIFQQVICICSWEKRTQMLLALSLILVRFQACSLTPFVGGY